jgi:glycosyltransferase involved in cell wall biosynthesis
LDEVQERRAAGVKLVAYSDATSFGGAEQALANLLAFLDPAYEISVLAVDEQVGETIRAARQGTDLHLVPRAANKWDAGPIGRHLRTVRNLRPDIFHANLWTTVRGQYGVIAALLARGVRTVVVEQSPLPTDSSLQRFLKRVSSRRLSAHVAVGERSARAVEEAVGLAPGSVRTIYNGVPDVPVEPLQRRSNGPVIGAVGRLSPEKGYDLAIRALQELPDTTLVLVGDGAERERLEALARDLGVSDRVEFAGWSAEPRRYLPGFDAFVLPSRQEGFPLAVVEAMLAEVPVVAADVGSVSEAVLDEETGYLVPAENPGALAARLRLLLSDRELAHRLGASGRARAQANFTAEAMARSFERLYREILG